jgi:DNA primase
MSRAGGAGRAERDAQFRRAVDEAKDRHNISDVIGRDRKVTRAGREKRALCAFHTERSPSMQMNDAKGTFHCFGCGKSGDIVSYVMETQGLRFVDALRWLGAADLPMVDPAERAKAAEEDAAERQAAIDRAAGVWAKAVPAAGTPAEIYARSRGITAPLPDSIRFVMTPSWYDDETGECGPDLPALVGAVTDATGLIGLQRIFLADGGRRKAGMAKPKRSLGRVKGGALRLGRAVDRDVVEIIVTEGPEDGLSLAQEMPGAAVWVTLGTAMMPEVQYPPHVTSIVIAGQNDTAGRAAVQAAALALTDRGKVVRTMYPAEIYKDWNDQLRDIRL